MSGYAILVGFRCHPFGETATQMRTRISPDNIPHLVFPLRTVALPSQCVVGMHLNRKILLGIDEFDQQRKFVTETSVIGLSEQIGTVPCKQTGERQAGIGALGDDRFASGDAGQFPAFADLRTVGNDLLVGDEFLTAPQNRLQYRYEFVHLLSLVAASERPE